MLRGILFTVLGGALFWLAATRLLPRLEPIWGEGETEGTAAFLARPTDADPPAQEETAPATEAHPAPVAADDEAEAIPIQVPPGPESIAAPSAASASAPPAFHADLERVDRTELGRILAHEDRYQVLESYLNEGEGARLPEAARKLVSAFWLALNGQHAEAEALAAGLDETSGVTSEQLAILATAIAGERPRARQASSASREPMALGMEVAWLDRLAEVANRKGRHQETAEVLSEVLLLELAAPWPAERANLLRWMGDLNEAQQHHRWNPAGAWPSQAYEVRGGESLVSIRKHLVTAQPELLLCVGLLERVNGLGPRPIQPGQTLRIPTQAPSALVYVEARVLLYLHGEEVLQAWEIGTGKPGLETPTGSFTAGLKQEDPSYMPIGGPDLPFGHPDNPLGTRWIAWYRAEERTGYGIHGTNDPSGIGAQVSNGCVRMTNADVEALFEVLPLGASIVVRP